VPLSSSYSQKFIFSEGHPADRHYKNADETEQCDPSQNQQVDKEENYRSSQGGGALRDQ